MKEIETKNGAVKVYCAGPHTYLRTSACVQPTKERPAPELIEGQQVRLSIDEARIVGKALLRCVAEAEEHLEYQKKLEKRQPPPPAEMVLDVRDDDVPAFVRPDYDRVAQALAKREQETMELLKEAARKRNRKGKLGDQLAEDPMKVN